MRNLRGQLEEYQAILAKRLDKGLSQEDRKPPVVISGHSAGGIKRRKLLYALAGQKLKEVTQALERIDEGVYGACVVCGKPIAEKRLQAMPTATHCWTCQQKL